MGTEKKGEVGKGRGEERLGWAGGKGKVCFYESRQYLYFLHCLLFSSRSHPLNESDQKLDILIRHGINVFDGFLLCQGGLLPFVEKFHGSYAQIFADVEEFTHGRQRPAGCDTADIAGAVAQIQTHLSLRDLFFLTETGDPVPDKLFIYHVDCSSLCVNLKPCIKQNRAIITPVRIEKDDIIAYNKKKQAILFFTMEGFS